LGTADGTAGSPYGITWYNNANALHSTSPTSVVLNALLCPSDGQGDTRYTIPAGGIFSRANYLGFFGNADYGAMWKNNNPFYLRSIFALNFGANFANITDGTSNTMAMGEYLKGSASNVSVDGATGKDFRGTVWFDQPGYCMIHTQTTPNSSVPDFIYTTYCAPLPRQNLPCVSSNAGGNDSATSRSRHPGGVNILFCDGSVKFIKNTVNLSVYRGLGSIAGGEVLSADSY